MGRVKEMLMDQQEYYDDYDAALFEYQQIMYEEEQIRLSKTAYQLEPGIEEDSYNLYMEGKLCGEQANTVHLGISTNSSTGQQTNIRLRTKRNSNG